MNKFRKLSKFIENRHKVEEKVERLTTLVESLNKKFDSFYADHKKYESVQKKFKGQMLKKTNALLRHSFLDLDENLLFHRFQIMSQNEEDGITLSLINKLNSKNKTFVDIGCGRNGGNSGILAAELGWNGLMVDSNEMCLEKLSKRISGNPNIKYIATFVSPENINTLIRENVKEDPVIISIDIDSYDYFVLEALEYTPEILIMEYNSSFGLEPVTVPLDSLNDKTPKGFHGASLVAITKLAKKKGYRLVVCDESGTNAYFLRDDVLPNIPGVLPEIAFRPQKTRKDPFNEEPRTINLAKLVEVSGQELQQV